MQISIALGLALGAFAVTTQSVSARLTGKKVLTLAQLLTYIRLALSRQASRARG